MSPREIERAAVRFPANPAATFTIRHADTTATVLFYPDRVGVIVPGYRVGISNPVIGHRRRFYANETAARRVVEIALGMIRDHKARRELDELEAMKGHAYA